MFDPGNDRRSYVLQGVPALRRRAESCSPCGAKTIRIAPCRWSLVLLTVLISVLGLWMLSTGSVSVVRIVSRKAEAFYWVTILFSNTLGTALGDFFADDSGLGYEGAALVFAGVLALIAAVSIGTNISRTLLFWLAFILTRRSERR